MLRDQTPILSLKIEKKLITLQLNQIKLRILN